MPFRIAIATLGCKTNHYDSAALVGTLDPEIFVSVPFDEEAEAYIVNSCAVTQVAERQSRQMAYRARRRSPQALVILAGCTATLTRQDRKEKLPEIDYLVSREDTVGVAELLTQAAREAGYLPRERTEGEASFGAQSRPYLKVEDGCEGVCTYCVIPRVRGPVRSVPVAEAVAELHGFAARGFREVVLTGIHVGMWGRDLPGHPPLLVLLSALAEAGSAGGLRLRLSSLEPQELDEATLDLIAENPVFCPHLHIPLQSGCDSVLARMRRPYDTALYASRVAYAQKRMPRLGLGADVITGFPGETEAEARQTYDFIAGLPFSYLHVFPYSARPGTPAASFPGLVPQARVRAQKAELTALALTKKRAAAEARLNSEVEMLVEAPLRDRPGFWRGTSGEYLPVEAHLPDGAAHTLRRVRVVGTDEAGVLVARAHGLKEQADE